jgi:hypothetical protein
MHPTVVLVLVLFNLGHFMDTCGQKLSNTVQRFQFSSHKFLVDFSLRGSCCNSSQWWCWCYYWCYCWGPFGAHPIEFAVLLSNCPWNLYTFWEEYKFGSNGQKPAKWFDIMRKMMGQIQILLDKNCLEQDYTYDSAGTYLPYCNWQTPSDLWH